MYSQNNEEKFIREYFSEHIGKFVDVGAFHPFKLSNTRKLVEIGWKGVYVEPSPKCFASFVTEYANESTPALNNKNITLLNVGLAESSGQYDFYESDGDAISTTVLAHKQKWETAGVNYNLIKVDMMAVSEFEKLYCENTDFLSIDVESSNLQIFSLFSDTFLSSIKMLCIEHDNHLDIIRTRMANLGFTEVTYNPENIIFQK